MKQLTVVNDKSYFKFLKKKKKTVVHLSRSASAFLFTDRISRRTSSHLKKNIKPYANTRSLYYNR